MGLLRGAARGALGVILFSLCVLLADDTDRGFAVRSAAAVGAVALVADAAIRGTLRIDGPLLCLTPATFCQLDLLRSGGIRPAARYLIRSLVLIGTAVYLLALPRLLPLLLPIARGSALEAQVLDAFPADVVVRIRDGAMHMSPPPSGGILRIPISQAILRIPIAQSFLALFGGSLLGAVELLDIGVADLRMLGLALRFLALDGLHGSPSNDPYVRISEFRAGEAVEVLVDDALASGCGNGWRPMYYLTPPPMGGLWLPAVVGEVHPSSKVSGFKYTIRVGSGDARAAGTDDDGVAGTAPSSPTCASQSLEDPTDTDRPGDVPPADCRLGTSSAAPGAATPLLCQVFPTQLRRLHPSVIFNVPAEPGKEVDTLSGTELLDEGALLYFEEKRFAVLEGYSFHHKQHWQYRSASVSSSAPASSRAKLWHRYDGQQWHRHDDGVLHEYALLSWLVSAYCAPPTSPTGVVADPRAVQPGKDLEGLREAGGDLDCSRAVAREQLWRALHSIPGLGTLVRSSLHVPAILCGLWLASVLATIFFRALAVLFIYAPLAYVMCALLRHVDTPIESFVMVLRVVMYSSVPFIALRRFAVILEELLVDDGLLHPVLAGPVDFFLKHHWQSLMMWAFWNGFIVIKMREHKARAQHLVRISASRSQRGARTEAPATAAAHPIAAESVGVAGVADVAANGATCTDESAAPTDAPGAPEGQRADAAHVERTQVEEDDVVCRICYGGREVGRLVSPCLCSGTLRFVHLDCLNMWRAASANPQSFYQCDSCHYQYSFKRALYASVLRTAIVLHALSLVAFACVVLACSYVFVLLDRGFIDRAALESAVVSDEFLEHLANETGAKVDDMREHLLGVVSSSWHGINIIHLTSGLVMVALTGVFSLGFVYPPMFGGRGVRFFEGPLMFVTILIGTVRVMFMIYALFKGVSGRLLRSAESMILEVGTGWEAEAATAASAVAEPATHHAAPATPAPEKRRGDATQPSASRVRDYLFGLQEAGAPEEAPAVEEQDPAADENLAALEAATAAAAISEARAAQAASVAAARDAASQPWPPTWAASAKVAEAAGETETTGTADTAAARRAEDLSAPPAGAQSIGSAMEPGEDNRAASMATIHEAVEGQR